MPDVRPKIHPSTAALSHTISAQVRIRSAFFLRRTQLLRRFSDEAKMLSGLILMAFETPPRKWTSTENV